MTATQRYELINIYSFAALTFIGGASIGFIIGLGF